MKIKLKKLFAKNKDLTVILQSLSQTLEIPIQVHDLNEAILIEDRQYKHSHRYPLTQDGEILGWVSGDKRTASVVPLLNYLIAGETRKKSLADEVLNAYREITLLYNVSEKLTASLKIQHVIQVALSEATRLIKAISGIILLMSDQAESTSNIARFGSERDVEDMHVLAQYLLEALDQNSRTEIVNDLSSDYRFKHKKTVFQSLLWAPVTSQEKLLGVILLGHTDSTNEYVARDLGLLNTIASQTAPAVEKAVHYENLEKLVAERTEALTQAKNQAETANQAKSQFLANMSHELRTPLNALLGYAQILKQEQDLNEKQKDGLDIIHRSGEHLLTLINDILDLSKIEAGKMELTVQGFSLDELLTGLIRLFRFRASEKNIAFEYNELSPLPECVMGDEIKIRQILMNLLSNAIKFTEVGGVSFKVGQVQQNIRFEVEDTGIGIASNHLNEIFHSFRQISYKDRHMEGTGLGLAISHKLATMMSCELNVKSEPDKGSTFWFDVYLPETKISQAEHRQSTSMIVGYEGKRLNILIVEDREENRSVLINLLEPLGFNLMEANNGLQGLNMASEHSPDVVLMDLVMPVMDGFECMRRIRQLEHGKSMCIIALSASVFESDRKTTLEAGGDDFLPKPIRIDQLLNTLSKHLKIRWTYQTDAMIEESSAESKFLYVPQSKELSELMEAVRQGNIRRIRSEIERIQQLDKRYIPFCSKLNQFAKRFNMKQMSHFLESCLETSL